MSGSWATSAASNGEMLYAASTGITVYEKLFLNLCVTLCWKQSKQLGSIFILIVARCSLHLKHSLPFVTLLSSGS